jgi:hypothetical protein
MAYDGYRGSSTSSEPPTSQGEYPGPSIPQPVSIIPPYPSKYAPERIQMPQPDMSPPAPVPNISTQRGLNDAVATAINRAGNSAYLSPDDLISQVTANVIQQLKTIGLDGLQQQQQPQHQQQQYHQSPVQPSAGSPLSDTGRDAHAPPPSENQTFDIFSTQSKYPNRVTPPQAATMEKKSSPSNVQTDSHPGLSRTYTMEEITTLQKIWGKLFDDGKPTEKLSQFLRGIAVHLVSFKR